MSRRHLLMLLVRSSEQRPQHLLHRFTEIEIHADVVLGLGQREQTSRDGLDLLLLPSRVQGDDLQRQKLDGIEEISWPIQLRTPAFQPLERLVRTVYAILGDSAAAEVRR